MIEHFLGDVGKFLEQIRPWVGPGALVGILGLLLTSQIQNRRAKLAEQTLAFDDEKDIRDHYANEVQQLRAALVAQSDRHRNEIRDVEVHYKAMVEGAEKRHEECQKSREELREQVNALRDLVAGLQRTIIANSASQAIALGDAVSPEVKDAAKRVEELFDKRRDDK